ncbi:MAG TPA: hypothetical protein VH575_30560 [Gemmataceae bacterium]
MLERDIIREIVRTTNDPKEQVQLWMQRTGKKSTDFILLAGVRLAEGRRGGAAPTDFVLRKIPQNSSRPAEFPLFFASFRACSQELANYH